MKKTIQTTCSTKTVTVVATLRAKGYRIAPPFKTLAAGYFVLLHDRLTGFSVELYPLPGDENIFHESSCPTSGNPFQLLSLAISPT